MMRFKAVIRTASQGKVTHILRAPSLEIAKMKIARAYESREHTLIEIKLAADEVAT